MEKVPSLEQMCRWIVLSLRWPEVVRWLRHPRRQKSQARSSLAALENLTASSGDAAKWQVEAGTQLGLKAEEVSWLVDERLFKFFQEEAANVSEQQRISACVGMGLW